MIMVDQNMEINRQNKNEYKIDMQKKRLSKRNENPKEIDFLFFNTKIAFIELIYTFIKITIFCYFDSKYLVQISINDS